MSAEVALTPLNSGEKSATLTAEQIENIPIVGTSAAEVLRILPGMTAEHANGTNNTPELHAVRSTASTATARTRRRRQQPERHRQLLAPTATALGPSTSRSTAPPAPTPAATARPPSTRTPSSSRSSRSCSRTSGPSTPRARSAMSVVSKQGGREFHGSVFGYLRDYHLNSNEWFANKIGAERIKNKFTYPGFTSAVRSSSRARASTRTATRCSSSSGFEYFGQALDTGFVKSWVPTRGDAQRRLQQRRGGRAAAAASTPSRGTSPAASSRRSLIDPGGQALAQRLPDAERQPGARPAATTTSTTSSSTRTAGRASPASTSTSPTTRRCSCATTSSARRSPS